MKFPIFFCRFPVFLATTVNDLRNLANALWNVETNANRKPLAFIPNLKYKIKVGLHKGDKSHNTISGYYMLATFKLYKAIYQSKKNSFTCRYLIDTLTEELNEKARDFDVMKEKSEEFFESMRLLLTSIYCILHEHNEFSQIK